MTELAIAFIPPGTGKYRVRVPSDVAGKLGWPEKPGEGFQCFGFFRGHGELICSALAVEPPERIAKLRALEGASPQIEQAESFSEVPDPGQLMIATRIIEFRAIWLKPPHTQLELQLSAPHLAKLGWYRGSTASLVALAHSKFLLLMSERRYAEAHIDIDV